MLILFYSIAVFMVILINAILQETEPKLNGIVCYCMLNIKEYFKKMYFYAVNS